jgi:hypothetical protein
MPSTSTKSRQTIYGGPTMGAKIRAEGARKRAREADRAEAEAWSLQTEALADLRSRRQQLDNALMGASAGLRWSAGAVRRISAPTY